MVKIFKMKKGLGFLTLMFGLSGWVNGACLIEDTINTTGVQSDSGQGNYDCSVLNTSDGTQMEDLISLGFARDFSTDEEGNPLPDNAIRWEVDKNIYGQPLYQVHLVSTFNKGQGKRCNYLYGNLSTEDYGLGAEDSGPVDTVTVCGDPTELNLGAPQSDIITTVGNGCDASFTYDETNPDDSTLVPDVSLGFSASTITTDTGDTVVQPETIAVCSSVDNPNLPAGQIECAPNEGANANPDYDPTLCLAPTTPVGEGVVAYEYDLMDCAPVLWDRGDLKYCWYYENKVCDVEGGIFCDDRTIGTFIPKTDIANFDASIGVHNGSTTYTVCFRGRCYYQ